MRRIVLMILSVCFVCVGIFCYPENVEAKAMVLGPNNINAKSYIVLDSNGKILLEKNADEKKPVASICKLMTTLITLEKIARGELSLDDKMLASEYACSVEGSQAFLDAGSEYLVKDLLKSVIVASANDSAIVLAENISGTENDFVAIMNQKAQEMGMYSTIYANSTGLTDKNIQYSTAKDTSIILNKITEFDTYKEYCSIWMDKLIHPSGRETELVNTNRLIRYLPYCVSGKTGFTDEAKYCLASTANKNDLKLTCVVLGCDNASDRFTDSINLYNFTYANFKNNKLISKGGKLERSVRVNRGVEEFVGVQFEQDFNWTSRVGENVDFDIVYNLQEVVSAPISEGDTMGTADIYLGTEYIGSINLVSTKEISEQKFADVMDKIITKFGILN